MTQSRPYGTKIILTVILITMVSAIIWLSGCGPRMVKEQRLVFDTPVNISIYPAENGEVKPLIDLAFERMSRVEKACNVYDKTSELAKINASDKRVFEVSSELADMIGLGIEWQNASTGTFDIGIGDIMQAWSFGVKDSVPSASALRLARAKSGLRGMSIKSSTLRFSGGKPQLDLNGLSKGYGADKAYEALRNNGIAHGLIDMGSSVVAFGGKPDGSKWTVGIRHPRNTKAIIGTLAVRDAFISTSGDYQQSFIRDGIRYHHIIDPQTSIPSRRSIAATVVSGDSASIADILSTTVFILGPKTGIKLLERLPETEGLIIAPDGKISMTSGMSDIYEQKVEVISKPAP